MAEFDGISWQYYAQDRLGSVRLLTDPAGKILQTRQYDPFGNPLTQVGTGQSPFGYTGQQTDSNGLVYLRARFYDPKVGRFLTKDPFPGLPTMSQTMNPYPYVVNNPVNLTDPSGEIVPLLIAALIIGAGVGGVGAGINYANNHPGVDYLCDPNFYQAVLLGMTAGAIGAGVGFFIPGVGGSLGAAILSGAFSGAVSAVVEQLVFNAFTPGATWTDGLLQAAVMGGIIGGVTGGLTYSLPRHFLAKFAMKISNLPKKLTNTIKRFMTGYGVKIGPVEMLYQLPKIKGFTFFSIKLWQGKSFRIQYGHWKQPFTPFRQRFYFKLPGKTKKHWPWKR